MALPQLDDLVRVRSRQYLVDDVVAPRDPRDTTKSPLVRLSCIEDDADGERIEVLSDASWEIVAREPQETVETGPVRQREPAARCEDDCPPELTGEECAELCRCLGRCSLIAGVPGVGVKMAHERCVAA